VRVGILGATGYTGQELVRLLRRHPDVDLTYLGSSSMMGHSYQEIYPNRVEENGILAAEAVPELDVLFCALPHGITASRGPELLGKVSHLIDLGADFRLRSVMDYESWYGIKHPEPELLLSAVYGLPELYREDIQGHRLVANPGCYPTATLLALTPLLRASLLEPDSIIIDAKSGVSGAGRGLSAGTHYAEVNENIKAYGVGEHRHTPEIEQELTRAAGRRVTVNFTPHLVPMTRGILVTIYADVTEGVEEQELRAEWWKAYKDEEFINLLPVGTWPQTKFAYGSNQVFLQMKLDPRTKRIIIVAVLDNLIKGAAGQAIQNMNILAGLPEGKGLGGGGLWP